MGDVPDVALETDVYNGEAGHAAKHNAVNAQVNELTEAWNNRADDETLTASIDTAIEPLGVARALNRNAFPTAPTDLGTMLTPAPAPFEEKDGLWWAVGWDRSWLIGGEDVQLHVVNKRNMSTYRMDRSPDWSVADVGDDGDAWYVAVSNHIVTPTNVSPNSFTTGAAKESWTFTAAAGETVETGYAVVVGTGDYTGTTPAYRAPTVLFCREGATAAQSLTAMLDAAGIMSSDYTTPKSLQGIARSAADTFYLYGSGENASTNPGTERPTFGRMVLTLNSSKTETGASAVSSLTWTDRLSVLQATVTAAFAGENIVNVAAVSDQHVTGTTKLLVLVVTKDGSNVLRGRMVEFDTSNATAAMDTRLNANGGGAVWPLTPGSFQRSQTASIAVGDNGVLFTMLSSSGVHPCYYRASAGTTWVPVLDQINRAMGVNGLAPQRVLWDDYRSRFLVVTSSTVGGAGWLDADCKQGHYLSRLFPWRQRIVGQERTLRAIWADRDGVLILGAHQLAAFFPHGSESVLPGNRVIWGCRVTGIVGTNDKARISAGEVEMVDYQGNVTRVYVPGNDTAGNLTDAGPPHWTFCIVAKANGTADEPGVGFSSGLLAPEPAQHSQVILAHVTRVIANGAVITAAEIDQTPPLREV